MAVKKTKVGPSFAKASERLGGKLDPKEEKMLDWILNAVVIFVLGWLGLGILLSVGGLFKLWG
ncbi:MAG: hypothetical protein AAB697_03940 [Patescibacteria group bacterium]